MEDKIFKLKGKTLAIIDWANVYGWFEKLKWEIDPKKLYDYLKSYPQIFDIRLYFGVDKENPNSLKLHKTFKKIGYNLQWKEIKWVPIDLKLVHYKDETGKIRKFFETAQGKRVYEKLNKFKEIVQNLQIYRRKCDFDVEITRDVFLNIDKFDGLILFSGDGDYAPLVEELIKKKKQVIVVFAPGCKGREFEDFKKGLYLCSVKKLKKYLTK
jgi:uncharacterized LabA/DUF88 family protein